MANKKTQKKSTRATRATRAARPASDGAVNVQPGDSFKEIPLSDIHADMKWNGRSGDWQDPDNYNPESGESGFRELCESIAAHGQDTPVLVRPRASGKGVNLVAGFRRIAAIKTVAKGSSKDKNHWTHEYGWPVNKKPTVRVQIRVMTDMQARSANIRENTGRLALSGPDLGWAVADYCRQYVAAHGENPSSVQVAREIGKNQSYVNKLMKIMGVSSTGQGGLPLDVLETWRAGGTKGKLAVSTDKMVKIAEKKSKGAPVSDDEKRAAYAEAAKGPGDPNPEQWLESAKTKIARVAGIIGSLERAGAIELTGLSFTTHLDQFDEHLGLLKKPNSKGEGGATTGQKRRIVNAAQAAYNKAFDGEVTVEDEGEGEGEE
jgi:hypothetical protein